MSRFHLPDAITQFATGWYCSPVNICVNTSTLKNAVLNSLGLYLTYTYFSVLVTRRNSQCGFYSASRIAVISYYKFANYFVCFIIRHGALELLYYRIGAWQAWLQITCLQYLILIFTYFMKHTLQRHLINNNHYLCTKSYTF